MLKCKIEILAHRCSPSTVLPIEVVSEVGQLEKQETGYHDQRAALDFPMSRLPTHPHGRVQLVQLIVHWENRMTNGSISLAARVISRPERALTLGYFGIGTSQDIVGVHRDDLLS